MTWCLLEQQLILLMLRVNLERWKVWLLYKVQAAPARWQLDCLWDFSYLLCPWSCCYVRREESCVWQWCWERASYWKLSFSHTWVLLRGLSVREDVLPVSPPASSISFSSVLLQLGASDLPSQWFVLCLSSRDFTVQSIFMLTEKLHKVQRIPTHLPSPNSFVLVQQVSTFFISWHT